MSFDGSLVHPLVALNSSILACLILFSSRVVLPSAPPIASSICTRQSSVNAAWPRILKHLFSDVLLGLELPHSIVRAASIQFKHSAHSEQNQIVADLQIDSVTGARSVCMAAPDRDEAPSRPTTCAAAHCWKHVEHGAANRKSCR